MQLTLEQRITWLRSQLAEIQGFIERDAALLARNPTSQSAKVSLNSWRALKAEYARDLSQLLTAKVER